MEEVVEESIIKSLGYHNEYKMVQKTDKKMVFAHVVYHEIDLAPLEAYEAKTSKLEAEKLEALEQVEALRARLAALGLSTSGDVG